MADANLEMFAAVSVLGIGTLLCILALLSYARLRTQRFLLLGLAFLALVAKGAYLTSKAWESRGELEWIAPVAGFDLAMALLLYFAVRKP